MIPLPEFTVLMPDALRKAQGSKVERLRAAIGPEFRAVEGAGFIMVTRR